MNGEEQKIIDYIYDVEIGGTNPQSIYKHFEKKIGLGKIKDVLSKIETKQLNINKKFEKSQFIPIVAHKNGFQADLTFYKQYSKFNDSYDTILNIIDMNTKF